MEKVQIKIVVEKTTKDEIKRLAKESGLTISAYMILKATNKLK